MNLLFLLLLLFLFLLLTCLAGRLKRLLSCLLLLLASFALFFSFFLVVFIDVGFPLLVARTLLGFLLIFLVPVVIGLGSIRPSHG